MMIQENPARSDIIIAGAGPAGLSAAISLGKKGIPCLLIDQCHFPREKTCGDGLSGKVLATLDKLDIGLKEKLCHSGFVTGSHAVRFYSPANKMVEIPFPEAGVSFPAGYISKRIDFDAFLLEQALSYPTVTFREGIRIGKITRSGDKLTVESKDTGWKAETRLLLLATGANRVLFKDSGIVTSGIVRQGIGVRAYFENVRSCSPQHAIEIHFLRELLPWYLWIFPFNDGSANVGLALPMTLARKTGFSLKELLFQLIGKYPYLNERFRDARINGKISAHRLPFYTGHDQIAGDNYLLLGDAASLIDPFTGEGVSHALVSGMIAADTAGACLIKKDFRMQVTGLYQEKVYHALGKELELGLRLQGLAKRPELLNLVIGRASSSEKTRKALGNMLFKINTMGRLKNPLFYLKLLLRI